MTVEVLLCDGCELRSTYFVCPHDRALCPPCWRDERCRECRTDPDREAWT